jgi:hypothetical protein
MFVFPAFVNVVAPRVKVGLVNVPVIKELPDGSVATERASVLPVPPALFAHSQGRDCAWAAPADKIKIKELKRVIAFIRNFL